MTTQNPIDAVFSILADGWSLAAGTIRRVLKLTGGDVTITGNSIQNVTTFPAGNTTLISTNDLLNWMKNGNMLAGSPPSGAVLDVMGSIQISGSHVEMRVPKVVSLLHSTAVLPGLVANAARVSGTYNAADLTGYTQARLSTVFGPIAPPTTSGTYFWARDLTNSIDLAVNNDTDGKLRWQANKMVQTTWFNIQPVSQTDSIQIILLSTGGAGVFPSLMGHINIEFR